MPRLSAKLQMTRICLKYTIFLGRESRDTMQTPAGLNSGRQSRFWRLGSEMVSKRERKRDLASPLHDRKKGTKGSWINQGLGPRPGGSCHTQRGARKSMGPWPNQKWASQTNPNTVLPHPFLEADQAVASGAPSAVVDEYQVLWEVEGPSMAVCLLIHRTICIGPESTRNQWDEFLRGHKKISQINLEGGRNDCLCIWKLRPEACFEHLQMNLHAGQGTTSLEV